MRKSNQRRVFRLEALEDRLLLSASSLDFESISGGIAVGIAQTTDTIPQSATEVSVAYEIDVSDAKIVSILCTTEGTAGYFEFDGSGQSFSNAWILTQRNPSATSLLELYSRGVDVTYTTRVLTNAVWENELTGVSNNSISSAQSLASFSISTSNGVVQQATVVGQLDNLGSSDYFRVNGMSGLSNVQIYCPSAENLTLELYDSSQTLIAQGSSTDDLREVVQTLNLSSASTFYIKVAGGSADQGKEYVLSVTSNALIASESGVSGDFGNSLSISGVGVGFVPGTDSTYSEQVFENTSGKIIACDTEGSRAVLLCEDSSSSALVLKALNYTNGEWAEVASQTLAGTFSTLSLCGDNILLGNAATNSATVVKLVGSSFVQTTLNPPSGLDSGALFGSSVLMAEDFAVVAAEGASGTGSVFIYQATSSGWALVRTLSGDTQEGKFGSALAYDAQSGLLCIGAEGENELGSGRTGSVWIYRNYANNWILDARLLPTASSGGAAVREFGSVLDISNETLVVGATDAAFVYERGASGRWTRSGSLNPPSSVAIGFGSSVSISGSSVVVSAPYALDAQYQMAGAAYVFVKSSGSWSLAQEIYPTVSESVGSSMQFGSNVVLNGGRLDVLDGWNGTFRSVSNFASVNEWTLNVTGTAAVQFAIETINSNAVAPSVSVYDPNGNVVSVSNGSFTPTLLGEYRFVLSAAGSAGAHYVLSILSGTYAEESFGVVVQGLEDGATLSTLPSEIVVVANASISSSSIALADVKIGSTSLEFKEIRDGNKLVWSVPQSLTNETTYTLTISGLQNLRANSMDTQTISFSYDKTIPTIRSKTTLVPTEESTIFAQIVFSEAMMEDNFNDYTIQLTNRRGVKMSVQYDFDTTTNTLSLSTSEALPDGAYTLVLAGGAGGLCDLAGNFIAASETLAFSVDSEGNVPLSFESYGPDALQILVAEAQSNLSSPDDIDTFVIPMYVASRESISWELSGPTGAQVEISGADGYYALVVSGENIGDAEGDYTLRVFINAQVSNSLVFRTIEGKFLQATALGTLDAQTSSADYSLTLSAGQATNFVLSGVNGVGATLALYEGGTLIANGVLADDGTLRIEGLKNTSASEKTYTLRVSASVSEALDFQITALSGAILETESNDSPSSAQDISDAGSVLGHIAPQGAAESVLVQETQDLSAAQLESMGVYSATSGDWTAVAGYDSLVLYQRSGSAWQATQTIDFSQKTIASVALDEGILVVGFLESVLVYEKTDAGAWALTQTLEDSSGEAHDLFGYQTAISDGRIAVSVPMSNEGAGGRYGDAGSVVIFEKNAAGSWEATQTLVSQGAQNLYYTGYALAMEGDTLVMLALTNNLSDEGYLSVWECANGVWSETALLNSGCTSSNLQLAQVAISNGDVFLTIPPLAQAKVYSNLGGTWALKDSVSLAGATNPLEVYAMGAFGSRIWISYQTSESAETDTYFVAAFQYDASSDAWILANSFATDAPAISFSGDETRAFANQLGSDGPAAAAWDLTQNVDYYRFVAASSNVSISSNIAKSITILNAQGEKTTKFAAGGTYYIAVAPTDSEAQRYFISVSGADANDFSCEALLEGGSRVSTLGNKIALQFSHTVDISSVESNYTNLRLGNFSCTGYEVQDGRTIIFTFGGAPQSDGTYSLSLTSGAFRNLAGETLVPSVSITLDTTAPMVENVVWSERAGSVVRVVFAEGMDLSRLTLDDAQLVGERVGSVSPTAFSWDAETQTLEIDFGQNLDADLFDFQLDLRLCRDLAGNSGESLFQTQLGVNYASTTLSDAAWESVLNGLHAQQASLVGCLSAGATNSYCVSLSAGETLSIGNGTFAGLNLVLKNSAGTACSWGEALAAGTYTIEATNSSAGTLVFDVALLRNTQKESDGASAQTKQLSFTNIDAGSGLALCQASVLGTLGTVGERDYYDFVVSAGSYFSIVATGDASADATLILYGFNAANEAVEIARGSSLDSLSSWIAPVKNVESSDAKFRISIQNNGAASGDSNLGDYQLVVTQNAIFNGTALSDVSAEVDLSSATDISEGQTAVGHVSQVVSSLADGVVRDLNFGYSLAADGRTLFVGAPGDNAQGESSGAVYVYEFDGQSYVKQATILNTDAAAFQQFGASVVFEDGVLYVAAPQYEDAATGKVGAIFTFENSGEGWAQTSVLLNPGSGTDFGVVMDVSGDIIVVGSQASGSSYVFQKQGSTWTQRVNLSTLLSAYAGTGSSLGYSVAIEGDYIAISAPSVSAVGNTIVSGVVFVVQRSGTSWSIASVLGSDNPTLERQSGYAVDIDNGTIVFSSFFWTDTNDANPGLKIYSYDIATQRESSISLDSVVPNYLYESSLRLEGDTLYVGGSSTSSALLVLKRDASGAWAQTETLPSPSSVGNVSFGKTIDLASGAILTSDPNAWREGTNAGSVYVYNREYDLYKIQSAGSSVGVTLSNSALKVELLDATGSVLQEKTGSCSFDVASGETYYLRVSAAFGAEADYMIRVEGIVEKEESLTLASLNHNGTSASAASRITLTFTEAVRADKITCDSVVIFNGKEEITPESWEISDDGTQVSFVMPTGYVNYSTCPEIRVNGADFATLGGAQIASFSQSYTLADCQTSTKLQASETSTSVVWTFGESIVELNDWTQAVSISSSRFSEIASRGTFEFSSNTLTWRADSDVLAQSGDTLTITLDAELIRPTSGTVLRGLTQTSSGDFVLTKSIVANTNAQLYAALVVTNDENKSQTNENSEATFLPPSLEWTHEWANLWAEVWVQIQSSTQNGVQNFSAEIFYDAALFTPALDAEGNVIIESSGAFDFSAEIVEPGVLRVSASTTQAGRGLNTYALLGRVRFAPGTGGVDLDLTKSEISPVDSGLSLSEDSIVASDSAGSSVSGLLADEASELPAVYPIMYDLNDNGFVDAQDLITFILNFGRNATYSATAFHSDFDGDGSVQVNDLILFIRNFGQRAGRNVLFDDGFPAEMNDAQLNAILAVAVPVEVAAAPVENAAVESVAIESAEGTNVVTTLEVEPVEDALGDTPIAQSACVDSLVPPLAIELKTPEGRVWSTQWGNVFAVDLTSFADLTFPSHVLRATALEDVLLETSRWSLSSSGTQSESSGENENDEMWESLLPTDFAQKSLNSSAFDAAIDILARRIPRRS
ncbi:MAG: hypothetical protein Q4D38_05245 [Planctomycetia bacterium]|nr:hypothetical protein [Planctomycetia bacterium]